MQFIEKDLAPNGEKLGTYGIIKGASLYLGITIKDEEYAAEAVGYDFVHPLSKSEAGDYEYPLEMLRLAPSAVNKQPMNSIVNRRKNSGRFLGSFDPG